MSEATVIDDGQISVRIQEGPLDGQLFHLDVLALLLAADPLERKHKVFDEGATPGNEFYTELAAAFSTTFEISPCSVTLAYKLWHAAWERWNEVKKNMPFTPS